jgi:hypothetical protein
MIKGVKFVNILVADQALALAFYTEKLGFTVATNQPMGPAVDRAADSGSRHAGDALHAAGAGGPRGHVRAAVALGRRR